MPTVQELRRRFPQYGDLSDAQLLDQMYQRHYADKPREWFDSKMGVRPAPVTTAEGPTNNPRVPEFGLSAEGQAPAPSRVGRALQVGAQGAGAGLAELALMPLDLAAGVVNLGIHGANAVVGSDIPRATPASELVRRGVSNVARSVGVEPIDSADMNFNEKVGYNINRFGTQAAAAIPALVRLAARRGAEFASGSAPKWFDPLIRPYAGENVGRTIVGDIAAAGGAGTAVAVAEDQGYGENPVVATVAPLAGGVGGMTVAGVAERAGRAAAGAVQRPFGGNIDREVSARTNTSLADSPVTKSVSDRAARMLQDEAVDPSAAASRIRANQAELQGLTDAPPMPSPAALSEDPGLAAFERKVRLNEPGTAVARDREFNSAVRDTIDRVAPDHASPQHLVDRVSRAADARTQHAQREVDYAQGRQRAVAESRSNEAEASVEPYVGRGSVASERLDEAVVDRGYVPARAEKNRQFDEAPGRRETAPTEEVRAAAARVAGRINQLGPERAQLPADFVTRIQNIVDEEGVARAVSGGELADLRKFLSSAHAQARAAGNFDLADNLAELRGAVNRTIERMPGYAEANENYRQFAETYRPGPGDAAAKFTRDLDRDPTRSNTPPSQTASRFLRPGSPEKAEALSRITGASTTPDGGRAAAREYLLADMAGSGVLDPRTGVIRPDRLRRWSAQWGAALETAAPGFQREVNDMIRRAARGERLSGRFGEELRDAQRNLQRTQDQIDKGALGLVMQADPDKAVAAVMDNKNRTGKLFDELINVTAGDPRARNGLKAAVRDYLVDKATTGASEKLRPGDRRGPVSQAKLAAIFKEHEREMAAVFSPEEMNNLRAGHRALELANIERLRTSSGSDTAEKVSLVDKFLGSGLGRGVEAALRLKYGILKAGGLVATTRRVTSGITGGPNPDEVLRVVERAAFDPELMTLLLGRKMPISSPAWNAKLNMLLAGGEGARNTGGEEQ